MWTNWGGEPIFDVIFGVASQFLILSEGGGNPIFDAVMSKGRQRKFYMKIFAGAACRKNNMM